MALDTTDAELLVFLDADVVNFGPHFVTGLLGPLLFDPGPARPDVALVKGFYERPLHGEEGAGGRVTELVARPVIDLLFPHLAAVRQPLAGRPPRPGPCSTRPGLAPGYGVELALLIDVAQHFGVEQVTQVDLGVRIHRNRPLAELRPQATDVLGAALRRAGVVAPDDEQRHRVLRPTRNGHGARHRRHRGVVVERSSGSGAGISSDGVSSDGVSSDWASSDWVSNDWVSTWVARDPSRRGRRSATTAPTPTTATPTHTAGTSPDTYAEALL